MFFSDRQSSKKVNLGNKNVTKKEDFLKKIKEDRTKDLEKVKIKENNAIITKFFEKLNVMNFQMKERNELVKNLKTVQILLEKKNFLDFAQKEQIAIKAITKTQLDLGKFFICRNIPNSAHIELMWIVLNLFNYISPENLNKVIENNVMNCSMMKNMLMGSLVQVYKNLRNEYLVDNSKDIVFFSIWRILQTVDGRITDRICSIISRNLSALFIFRHILNNSSKIIEDSSKIAVIKVCSLIADKLILKRLKFRENKAINEGALHKLVDEFLESLLLSYMEFFENHLGQPNDSIAFEYNNQIFPLCTCIYNKSFVKFFNDVKLIHIMNQTANYIEQNNNEIGFLITSTHKRQVQSYFSNIEIEFFAELFQAIRIKDFNTAFLAKLKTDRKSILRSVNVILEYVMEATTLTRSTYDIEKIILLIYQTAKLLEYLYQSNFEKTDYHSILDYILNKVSMKWNSMLPNKILHYSVDLLKYYFDEDKKYSNSSSAMTLTKANSGLNIQHLVHPEETFEIIAFVVINQIEYKSNYFFVEFQSTKDIYKNLPFNYMYLNIISKFLIGIFTQLISKTNLEDIERLNQNMIIKCLKSLYRLDGEINFTFNPEYFWTNMSLASKLHGSNQTLLIEKMKVMPFIFPFVMRLTALTKEAKKWASEAHYRHSQNVNFRSHHYDDDMDDDPGFDARLQVPRENMFDSTLALYLNNRLLPHMRWRITFIDKFGNPEPGIDAGGLYKEFIYKLSEQAFNTNTGLFMESATGFLLPNPNSGQVSDIHLSIFEFLGFLAGTAICDDIKIAPNLSVIFINNVLEVENSFTELKSYDPELYKNLISLKNYEGDVENDFGLTFSITDNRGGKIFNFNLIDKGDTIPVTNDNRLLYIKKVTEYKLSYQFKEQCDSFKRGMEKVVNLDVIQIFTPDELRQLIYGFDKSALDAYDLRANTVYENWNFNDHSHVDAINSLWEILEEFDDKEKEKFLFFVTSLKRAPIGGFSRLSPPFRLARSHKEVPTSSTCTNMLHLPILEKEKMREILRYVINADAGFYFA